MDIQNLKGIGPKTIEYFYQAGIYNLEDLLTYYPYRYQILAPEILANTLEDETVTINATIQEVGKVSYIKKNLNSLRMKAESNGILFTISIFNRAFLKPHLKVGQEISVTGKYKASSRMFVASNLKLQKLFEKKIIPVYHTLKGIKPFSFEKIMQEALKEVNLLEDYIPSSIQKKYHFLSKKEAITCLHFPKEESSLEQAKRRTIYEEFFVFLFKVQYLKLLKTSEQSVVKKIDVSKVEEFILHLPFTLTDDQKKGIEDGLNDFGTKKRMNRLLLGDVGSGKTIVATVLMYANTLAGYQSAFMAPTEILATQHFYSIYSLMKPYSIRVELLIGSMTKKAKQNVMEKVASGEVDILIGTHAILNEHLKFAHLGFVVTDEQHRFGVNQRNTLQDKGVKPDVMFMSATPIPRTYALTVYGDMDTTMIKQKPMGRKPVITVVKKESELREVLFKVLEEIKLNHQIYVVAPMIEENDNTDLKTVNLLKEKFDLAFHGKVPIEVLHGKLKAKEKDEIMNSFKNGSTKILISTTVIEVGVDVPLATTMIIFNADRFGLATLHQLRGRVGRNDLQSYCYLICNYDVNRLHVLEESNDGFYISEKDYQFRGEGDLFGQRQSGDMSFSIANLTRDYEVLMQAKEDVLTWMQTEEYKTLPAYQKIIQQLKFNN